MSAIDKRNSLKKKKAENFPTSKKKKDVIDEAYQLSWPLYTLTCILAPVTPYSINFLVYFPTQTSHLRAGNFIIFISTSLAPMQSFAELNKHVLFYRR